MENPLLATNKSAVIQGNSVVIDFKSKEEAEEAFKKLLKDSVNINFIFVIINNIIFLDIEFCIYINCNSDGYSYIDVL